MSEASDEFLASDPETEREDWYPADVSTDTGKVSNDEQLAQGIANQGHTRRNPNLLR